MKVTYEFTIDPASEDYLDQKIFEKSQDMYSSLLEMENYLFQLKRDYIDDDKDKIIERLFEIIFDSRIGDIE